VPACPFNVAEQVRREPEGRERTPQHRPMLGGLIHL